VNTSSKHLIVKLAVALSVTVGVVVSSAGMAFAATPAFADTPSAAGHSIMVHHEAPVGKDAAGCCYAMTATHVSPTSVMSPQELAIRDELARLISQERVNQNQTAIPNVSERASGELQAYMAAASDPAAFTNIFIAHPQASYRNETQFTALDVAEGYAATTNGAGNAANSLIALLDSPDHRAALLSGGRGIEWLGIGVSCANNRLTILIGPGSDDLRNIGSPRAGWVDPHKPYSFAPTASANCASTVSTPPTTIPPVVAPAGQKLFEAQTPQRIFDSRSTAPVGVMQVTLTIPGQFYPGDAVDLNVTAVSPAAAGFVTVYPCGGGVPNVSNLNFKAGDVIPNHVIVAANGGAVCVSSSVPTGLIVDLQGVWRGSRGFVAQTPTRTFDSRNVAGGAPSTGGTIQVAGLDPARAFFGNVTVVGALNAGFATVYPCAAAVPSTSNLNYRAEQTRAALFVATPDSAGNLCIFVSGGGHVIVDSFGSVSTTKVANSYSARLVDTRSTAPSAGLVAGSQAPATGTFDLLNVTSAGSMSPGFLTVFPCGQAVPNTSLVNYGIADASPNSVSTTSSTCVQPSSATNVIVDRMLTLFA
jgi:hypothetical protein